jgi:hypothetical protein
MGRIVSSSRIVLGLILSAGLVATSATAATPEAIISALRISGIVTGGTMPTNSADFTSMVAAVESGDAHGAALIAVQSQYGSKYLLRRLALQMQNPSYSAADSSDSDATAFLIAHFAGVGGAAASISKIWSDNMTCKVRNAGGNMVSASALSAAELNTIDWRTALSCTAGQTAIDSVANTDPPTMIAIPEKHVGGYMTLSDRNNDNSFAQIGASAGTNLRFIVNMWVVATGMDIMDFANSDARPQNVPRFVPENDPNFLIGAGQTACISCHGGGLVALNHGYATMADLFDFGNNGFSYNKAPTTGSMKSLGSDAGQRQRNLTCTAATAVCNPDSIGTGTNQSWDLSSTWGARGLLAKIDWTGPTAGQGLNTLGAALGKAGIVYKNMVDRVVREICPLGAISEPDYKAIVALGESSDDIKQVIAKVASNSACL